MNEVQIKLNKFILIDKFSNEIWKSRGLISSGIEISNQLNIFFNQCANELLKAKKNKYKSLLIAQLKQIDSVDYDTEERELIMDYFFKLSEICATDVKDELMKWMYGEDTIEIIKPKKYSNTEILTNSCSNCKEAIDTEIVEREIGIPDFAFTIVKCNNCSELNIIELGPEVKQFTYNKYSIIVHLPKSDYSREQALEKLKALKLIN